MAIELGAEVLLIDEIAGRRVARSVGLRPVGTLGALVIAKDRGLLPSVGDLLDRLRQDFKFHVSDSIREEILFRAGEGPRPEGKSPPA